MLDDVITCNMPRVGQLEQVLQIFGYLKNHHNAEMVFDPTPQEIDHDAFQRKDWSTSEFGHLEEKEEIPTNMAEPRGAGFQIIAKVDADHGTDTVTRRSDLVSLFGSTQLLSVGFPRSKRQSNPVVLDPNSVQ